MEQDTDDGLGSDDVDLGSARWNSATPMPAASPRSLRRNPWSLPRP